MAGKGYWVECIPVGNTTNQNLNCDLYAASVEGFPDADVTGHSPDAAIEKLRAKLAKIKAYYELNGQDLPKEHSPISPKGSMRSTLGWMSVYVNVD